MSSNEFCDLLKFLGKRLSRSQGGGAGTNSLNEVAAPGGHLTATEKFFPQEQNQLRENQSQEMKKLELLSTQNQPSLKLSPFLNINHYILFLDEDSFSFGFLTFVTERALINKQSFPNLIICQPSLKDTHTHTKRLGGGALNWELIDLRFYCGKQVGHPRALISPYQAQFSLIENKSCFQFG